jgi:hypothetical protein
MNGANYVLPQQSFTITAIVGTTLTLTPLATSAVHRLKPLGYGYLVGPGGLHSTRVRIVSVLLDGVVVESVPARIEDSEADGLVVSLPLYINGVAYFERDQEVVKTWGSYWGY